MTKGGASVADLVRLVEERVAAQGLTHHAHVAERPDIKSAPATPPRWSAKQSGPRLALGVSTFNRIEYLKRFVDTFSATRNPRFDWVLLIADDGSTDGTTDYMHELQLPGVLIIKIYNKGARIAGQTNSILMAADAVDFDFGIKCDDDLFFVDQGWDEGYFEAAAETGYDHLVFHDESWKPPMFRTTRGQLISRTTAENAMGCLWTFTPRLLRDVGFFDERSFPVRGHSHLDYTARACRQGFNQAETVWDWAGAAQAVALVGREDYVDTVDWKSPEVRSALSPSERERREAIVRDDRRGFKPFDPLPSRPLPVVELSAGAPELYAYLMLRGFAPPANGQIAIYDEAFVLNLPHHRSRWIATASALAQHSISFRRAETVNGYAPEALSEWQKYASTGPSHPIEKRIGRKLIESAGAWGYLSSAQNVIESAVEARLNRVMILDDDIIVATDFEPRLESIKSELPDSWKLLYLGASYENDERGPRVTGHLSDPGDHVNGSFAVAFNSDVYDLLLESISSRTWPFDSGPLRDVREAHPSSVLVAQPDLVIADVSESSIRQERDLIGFAASMGWDLDRFNIGREATGSTVSVIVWGGRDANHLRETLRSLRFQHYGRFRALVLISGSSHETAEMALECRERDPRVEVVVTDQSDLLAEFGSVQDLVADTPITHLLAGDVLFPDHLERMVGILETKDAAVPTGMLQTRGGLVNGQTGKNWVDLRQPLAASLRTVQRPSRALLSVRARELMGDLPTYSDHRLGDALAARLGDRVATEKDATLIVAELATRVAGSTSQYERAPFYLSPGRTTPIRVIREQAKAQQASQILG